MFARTWDVFILLQDGDKELEGDASLAKLPLVGFLFNIQ